MNETLKITLLVSMILGSFLPMTVTADEEYYKQDNSDHSSILSFRPMITDKVFGLGYELKVLNAGSLSLRGHFRNESNYPGWNYMVYGGEAALRLYSYGTGVSGFYTGINAGAGIAKGEFVDALGGSGSAAPTTCAAGLETGYQAVFEGGMSLDIGAAFQYVNGSLAVKVNTVDYTTLPTNMAASLRISVGKAF